jgi:hypothetical protein
VRRRTFDREFFDRFIRLVTSAATGSVLLAQPLVVFADGFGVADGDGVAVDGDDGFAGLFLGQFFGHAGADFEQGLQHGVADEIPARFLGAFAELGADAPHAVPDARDLLAELRFADHFLNVAQTPDPFAVAVARDGAVASASVLGTATTTIAARDLSLTALSPALTGLLPRLLGFRVPLARLLPLSLTLLPLSLTLLALTLSLSLALAVLTLAW